MKPQASKEAGMARPDGEGDYEVDELVAAQEDVEYLDEDKLKQLWYYHTARSEIRL
jgi:hypothetical protein